MAQAPSAYIYNYYGLYFGSCDSTLYPQVYYYINGAYYGVHPTTYLIPNDNSSNFCYLGFLDGGDQFILGASFMKGYYSIFDDDNSQVAFLLNVESNATVSVGPAPTEVFKPSIGVDFSYSTAITSFAGTITTTALFAYAVALVIV